MTVIVLHKFDSQQKYFRCFKMESLHCSQTNFKNFTADKWFTQNNTHKLH